LPGAATSSVTDAIDLLHGFSVKSCCTLIKLKIQDVITELFW
jgi:hypothetical protein